MKLRKRMASANKVLIIVQNLSVPPDKRVWLEALALKEGGYEVSIICPKGAGQAGHEVMAGIHLYRFYLPSIGSGVIAYLFEYGYSFLRIFQLSVKVWAQRRFSIIQACNPPDIFFIIGRFYGLFGKKFVFDQHDLCPELYLARFARRDFAYKALVFLERKTYQSADVVLTANQSFKDLCPRRCGVTPDKVFVVRNGPDLKEVAETTDAPRGNGKDIVCYSGIIGPQDGVDILIRAAAHLTKEIGRRNARFVIIGEGDTLSDMKQMVKDLDLNDAVTFTGWISDRKAFHQLLRSADLCVSPEPLNDMNNHSTFVKILDYMAVGKPIVAFDLKESRLSAQDAAVYATPNSVEDFAAKIDLVLGDASLQAKMAMCGRHRIETSLAWTYSKAALLRAYSQLNPS